jgi:hypothetical protein
MAQSAIGPAQTAENSVSSTVDIRGISLGMSLMEARNAIKRHKMAHHDEQPLTLSFSEAKAHIAFGDAPVDIIEIPNTKYVYAITTNNRPKLRMEGRPPI